MNEEVVKAGNAGAPGIYVTPGSSGAGGALSGVMPAPACSTVLAEQQLDPGIADVVIMLRNLGFNPTDSGDGVSKPDEQRDFDVKHVACAWEPVLGDLPDGAPVDAHQFFREAQRLQKTLGSGWKVEASFAPADSNYLLLATKNDPPGPRYASQVKAWGDACAGVMDGPLYRAGAALYNALTHELGRR